MGDRWIRETRVSAPSLDFVTRNFDIADNLGGGQTSQCKRVYSD